MAFEMSGREIVKARFLALLAEDGGPHGPIVLDDEAMKVAEDYLAYLWGRADDQQRQQLIAWSGRELPSRIRSLISAAGIGTAEGRISLLVMDNWLVQVDKKCKCVPDVGIPDP